ncbi:hypothetical protein VCRA2117O38_30300 [Vibrio crassostreae]|nr:hypothetical protein VCRA2117O38_30300 [Vibrio crassostreae]CAK2897766.1 hypothetical protein VCRA2117O36_30299 [Vibrio crassostreae]
MFSIFTSEILMLSRFFLVGLAIFYIIHTYNKRLYPDKF